MMDDTQRALWLAERAGKLTASRMRDAMDFLKSGKPSEKRSAYMRELLAERSTGHTMRHFVTEAMEHGLQYEDEAKRAYEIETGNLVIPSGFFDHPRIGMFGATPDGLVAGGGLIETKCPTTSKFIEWRLEGEVPEEHKPQMLAQMACTGRTWVDFVAYDPRIRGDPSRRIFIRRFEPAWTEVEVVERAAEVFLAELEKYWDLLNEAA